MAFKKECFPFKWLNSTFWLVLSLRLFLFGRFMIQKPKYTSLDHLANSLGKTVHFVWRNCATAWSLFSSRLN